MTKRHFEALANALDAERPKGYEPKLQEAYMAQWVGCCKAVADVCADANPRIDRARFLAACGLEG